MSTTKRRRSFFTLDYRARREAQKFIARDQGLNDDELAEFLTDGYNPNAEYIFEIIEREILVSVRRRTHEL